MAYDMNLNFKRAKAYIREIFSDKSLQFIHVNHLFYEFSLMKETIGKEVSDFKARKSFRDLKTAFAELCLSKLN